ncbi:outer membrane beta-barrel protein [Sphingopyxis sp. OPL5]|uniref:outer membrane beta-barrel protein n=1 Tax=Sphingopyxis sp. OPL5 TaxID=2486273 RepID=UPI00164DEA81|nr:outer membrane beta-barrel protein [Sphingopyxis sp. OPL5]QNO26727.1 outer membrane beta-barrel protein [Sphingopyxis sp. OPL5]
MISSNSCSAVLAAAILASTLLAPTAVQARDGEAYVQYALGLTDPLDTEFRVDGIKQANRVDYHTGQFDTALSVGYDFGTIRAEGEFIAQRSRIHDYIVNVPTLLTGPEVAQPALYPDVKGYTHRKALMANIIVETGGNGKIGLYGGLGIGFQNVKASRFRSRLLLDPFIDASSTRLVGQAIVGAYIPLSKNLDLGVKYRLIHGEGFKYTSIQGGQTFKGNFGSHSWLGTLAWNF